MNLKHSFLLLSALVACMLSAEAVPIIDKYKSLAELHASLREDYQQRQEATKEILEDYDEIHRQIEGAIDKNNYLSSLLYLQEQNYTFNLAWILKEINQEYERYKESCGQYEAFFEGLDVETERYERLLASLQKRVVDPELESCLDSCKYYAAGILDNYRSLRDTLSADRLDFEDADEQLKETNDYVETRFALLEANIFKNGHGSWRAIISDRDRFREEMKNDIRKQYSMAGLMEKLESLKNEDAQEENPEQGESTLLLYVGIFFAIALMLLCVVSIALVFLCCWIFQSLRRFTIAQRIIGGLLLGTLLFLAFLIYAHPSDTFIQALSQLYREYLWLLIAMLSALLIRVKSERLRICLRLYGPTIFMILIVIICRVSFLPDKLLTFVFGLVLLLSSILQLVVCIRFSRKAEKLDRHLGWISLAVSLIALVVAYLGYTFVAIMIMFCWYIQMAVILTIACLVHLIQLYYQKRVKVRIEKYQPRMASITGLNKQALQFGFTWFYDLVVGVVLPVLALLSVPFCLHLSMDIFDFSKLFTTIYTQPFLHLLDKDGADVVLISFKSVIFLVSLFCIFRYLNRVIHAFWQRHRYRAFLRKHHRRKVRDNELNLSLGNSIISVLVWVLYALILVVVLHIPVGSLTLIASGLSAGIGLALKDTINNFIFGIQLMSGRLRVGDIIECDGIRGKVTDINYQNTLLKVADSIIVFTNETLFKKNFRNLSRGSAYETINIPVCVGYGTDIEKVRQLLIDAAKVLRTKDKYDRDIVDPKQGVKVEIQDFGDSGIDICLKQRVLLEERNNYILRARELMYKTLMENGIDIPFPQYDVHLVKADE